MYSTYTFAFWLVLLFNLYMFTQKGESSIKTSRQTEAVLITHRANCKGMSYIFFIFLSFCRVIFFKKADVLRFKTSIVNFHEIKANVMHTLIRGECVNIGSNPAKPCSAKV